MINDMAGSISKFPSMYSLLRRCRNMLEPATTKYLAYRNYIMLAPFFFLLPLRPLWLIRVQTQYQLTQRKFHVSS
uniref:Uncharacterized protein n=1 Tax=Arundo donax TaxID=35708 RepID=A0A0A8Z1W0_ARUDO